MSTAQAQAQGARPSRLSYFELYPDRRPAAGSDLSSQKRAEYRSTPTNAQYSETVSQDFPPQVARHRNNSSSRSVDPARRMSKSTSFFAKALSAFSVKHGGPNAAVPANEPFDWPPPATEKSRNGYGPTVDFSGLDSFGSQSPTQQPHTTMNDYPSTPPRVSSLSHHAAALQGSRTPHKLEGSSSDDRDDFIAGLITTPPRSPHRHDRHNRNSQVFPTGPSPRANGHTQSTSRALHDDDQVPHGDSTRPETAPGLAEPFLSDVSESQAGARLAYAARSGTDLQADSEGSEEAARLQVTSLAKSSPPQRNESRRIKSIDEIVRAHAGAAYVAKMSPKQTPAQALVTQARARQAEEALAADRAPPTLGAGLETVDDADALESESFSKGVGELHLHSTPTPSRRGHSRGFSWKLARQPSASRLSMAEVLEADRSDAKSIRSFKSSFSGYGSPISPVPATLAVERELALVLKSPRLTKIANMRLSPNRGISVSYADVGKPDGHPVIVFLGLGSVRYLVALYDEMAEALNLRLLCLDRWGLGRTSDVADDKRGFDEWSLIVDEFADQLGLAAFSILAHSAGAPYALTVAQRMSRKTQGSVHLLAPWTSTSADSLAGAYKLLKFVPNGVLKTAQTAEWKLQSRRLGKPPSIQHAAVGYDAGTGQLTTGHTTPMRSGASVRNGATPSDRSTYTPSFVSRLGARVADDIGDPFLASPPSASRRGSIAGSICATGSLAGASSMVSDTELANGLLRASHAESLRGSTADLRVILDKTSRSGAPKYLDLDQHVKVWHGDRDERINLSSARSLERAMAGRCELKVVPGADHNLMTNSQVMLEVLQSLAAECAR